jgi:hypothetical protein
MIVVSGAWRQKDNTEFRNIYIREDIPPADRRKSTFECMRYKAAREGHEVSLSNDDGLLIIDPDGTAVFSLNNRFVKTNTQDHTDGED